MAQELSWTSILNKAREDRQKESTELDKECTVDSALKFHRPHFASWKKQLTRYEQQICLAPDKPPDWKDVIVETRAALRFGLLQCSTENEEIRYAIQVCVVEEFQWCGHLESVIAQTKGDSKCRLLAAQLLSNCMTGNSETARLVISDLPLSPSMESVNSTILLDALSAEKDNEMKAITKVKPTWVNMIIACAKSGSREALAAVIAALHNCIVALNSNVGDDNAFATRVAADALLINTVLRQIVQASAIQSQEASEDSTGVWDSATEWIYLVLVKLVRLGLFMTMYKSIASSQNGVIVPEQNILLHCLVKEAETYASEHVQQRQDEAENLIFPLGGDLETNESQESCLPVADSLCQLLKLSYKAEELKEDEDVVLLRRSAIISLVDLFAILLGVDTPLMSDLRLQLGSHSALIQHASKQLGLMVDDLNERSFGIKARELKMSQEDQGLLTGLVRLLGNMCFKCRQNQDLLRTTLVPSSKNKIQVIEDDNNDTMSPSRNALHVLLSCTSYATSCFTLREWSVVAIRNVLDNNTENQEVVAQLEAQNPVQSAALDSAGVRVNMDSKGKVSLAPLPEENDEEGG